MLLVSKGDAAIGDAASRVGEACTSGVRVGDGIEISVANGVFVVAGGMVEVGTEAIPQNWASSSPLEAEYKGDSIEKFSDSSGCLTVLSGHE
jgi:hypothetical protein